MRVRTIIVEENVGLCDIKIIDIITWIFNIILCGLKEF